MLIKNGSSKIIKVASSLKGLTNTWNSGLIKRASNNMDALNLDPDNYLYLRNRAVSALEIHGPNQNWDGFEHDELERTYSSFISKPISVDHDSSVCIGTVLDSEFISARDKFASFGIPLMPMDVLTSALNKRCSRDKDTFNRVFDYASKKNLVRGSDQKMIVEAVCKQLANTGWVENIWGIDKEAAEDHRTGLCQAILAGHVTDSSMGMMVEKSVCSACGNVATGELPEDEDFCDHIRLYKGQEIPYQGITIIPFEINRDGNFFEDSLILPFQFGGKAGGEGADKDAKLLEVYASKKKRVTVVKSYMETNPNSVDSQETGLAQNSDTYQMVGDMPENVEQNRDEYMEEKREDMQNFVDEQSAPGIYPEGTVVSITYEDADISVDNEDAIVIDEYDDGTLVVALENIDDPIEITVDNINDIVEYPEEMDYESQMEAIDVSTPAMTPEDRGA